MQNPRSSLLPIMVKAPLIQNWWKSQKGEPCSVSVCTGDDVFVIVLSFVFAKCFVSVTLVYLHKKYV